MSGNTTNGASGDVSDTFRIEKDSLGEVQVPVMRGSALRPCGQFTTSRLLG